MDLFRVTAEPDIVSAIHADPDFVRLRRRLRRFALVAGVGFMAWYLVFVLLSAYAHDVVTRPVVGSINLGVVLGLTQFVTTAVLMVVYNRYAATRLDPLVDVLRERAEAAS